MIERHFVQQRLRKMVCGSREAVLEVFAVEVDGVVVLNVIQLHYLLPEILELLNQLHTSTTDTSVSFRTLEKNAYD